MHVAHTSDNKIRKKWLLVTLLAFLLGIGYNALTFLPILGNTSSFASVSTFLMAVIESALFTYALYYYSYKKRGTLLLTLWCVITPSGILSSIREGLSTPTPLFFLSMVVYVVVYIWRFVLTLKLRKINKLSTLRSPHIPGYDEDVQAMKQARTIQELDTHFYQLIGKWPQFEPLLSKEYQKAKEELTTIDI